MKPSLFTLSMVCGVLNFLPVSSSHGAVYDLTSGGTVAVNGSYGTAYFTTYFNGGFGTGSSDPFLSIGADGTEQGYNSSAGDFNTTRAPQWNHEITLADLEPTRSTYFGVDYYAFVIDINEPGSKAMISLDSVKLFFSPTASQTTTNVESLGTKFFDLGTGNSIIYNDASNGGGEGDIAVFLPVAAFSGVGPNDKIYLYEAFGEGGPDVTSEGGYEETQIGVGVRMVPEASATLPLILVLGFGLASRRFIRRAAA